MSVDMLVCRVATIECREQGQDMVQKQADPAEAVKCSEEGATSCAWEIPLPGFLLTSLHFT